MAAGSSSSQQQQQQPPTIIYIRPYEEQDKTQVHKLIYDGTMDPIPTFFKRALFHELFFQAIIMTASLLFILVGLHFYTTIIISIPLVISLTFISIWMAHYYKAKYLHIDLNDIRRYYVTNSTNFFVAEAFYFQQQQPASAAAIKSSNECALAFITSEAEFNRLNSGGLIINSSRKRTIVGTVGLVRDRDHILTLWLRRMTVKKDWRRFGIGSAIVGFVIKYASTKGYTTLDLITTECHDSGRKLYEKKGFVMKQLFHKKILGLSSLVITMYFMSMEINKKSSGGGGRKTVLES